MFVAIFCSSRYYGGMKYVSFLVLALLLMTAGLTSQVKLPSVQEVSVVADAVLSPHLLSTLDAAPVCDLSSRPQRVGLQVGHWQNRGLPEELAKLRENDGAVVGELMEWEAMKPIADQAKVLLEAKGYLVDLLPATIPADYCAHAFISLHADAGSSDRTGYKAAGSAWDESGRSAQLAQLLESAYAAATQLPYESTVTVNMTRYYAFNSARFQHSIHPETPAALLETGFLTNENDRRFLMTQPAVAAQGVAEGVVNFLAAGQP